MPFDSNPLIQILDLLYVAVIVVVLSLPNDEQPDERINGMTHDEARKSFSI